MFFNGGYQLFINGWSHVDYGSMASCPNKRFLHWIQVKQQHTNATMSFSGREFLVDGFKPAEEHILVSSNNHNLEKWNALLSTLNFSKQFVVWLWSPYIWRSSPMSGTSETQRKMQIPKIAGDWNLRASWTSELLQHRPASFTISKFQSDTSKDSPVIPPSKRHRMSHSAHQEGTGPCGASGRWRERDRRLPGGKFA